MKRLLIFCPACGSIMVLKEKKSSMGVYVCRRCDAVKKIKTVVMAKRETVKYVAPPVPI
ncbi:MAG: hypothetical protein N3E38_02335 [Candidatus Aenigmarchaeota archaeon]|nr:hypothetical protein [Candidatus Aenigmarchaeota archaeon]